MIDPNYKNIGNVELISKRATRVVEVGPGGVLNDYVPFYFTPYSIMMLNIKTGYNGVPRVDNKDIVIFVSSVYNLIDNGVDVIFTNQHAFPRFAKYYTDPKDLGCIDWACLVARNFKHDPEDPGRKERYQAEGLAWRHVPFDAMLGICCYNSAVESEISGLLKASGKNIKTLVTPTWYF